MITGPRVGNALVAGDFNGDGKLDLATLNDTAYGPTSISVYPGNGDGTFGAPITDYVGVSGNLVAGDFFGDGKLDLAALNVASSGVVLLRGNGDGTFQAPVSVPAPTTFATILYTSDVNGDGRPDLILADPVAGMITTLLDDGDGTFSTPAQVALNPQDTPLVADVNGDGISDVLVVDGSGNILYRQGNPQSPGSFEPPVTINPGFPSRSIAWVPDTLEGPLLASVDAQDNVISLYAYRNGGFVRVGSLATGELPAQVVAADLNHDGWDDLVVRNAGDGTLSVFLSNGEGSFMTGFSNPFLGAVTIPVGRGVSDLEVIDVNGDGSPDLVVSNASTGQVSVLLNRGNGSFAPSIPYRAGVGLSAVDGSSGSTRITSPESTIGVAGGSLTPGAPISLLAADPGTETLDLLQGLGGGALANPVVLKGSISASVIRMADFNDDGIMDLAVLDGQGVSIYLGNGKGGFLPPVTYGAGPDPTGLTIADVSGDGQPDLVIGNPYGDVLVLLNQGNGTFAPYRNADQTVILAVADLTGNGSKDVIYADQGLDRVVVDYGAGNSTVLGDRSSGLLSPGAVLLADLNGDGIPDLIIANSGSNNVLVYPGLGNGQFGPAVNDGHGFFTGTNPTGLAVADVNGDGIPDLIVANTGSNDVSILLGKGKGSSWTMTPGPRIKTDAGPVAVAVGDLLGSGQLDLAVANQQANDVQVFPSVGNGFFNDTAPVTYSVGQAPSGLFLGNFTGQGLSIATLNAGSNTISLIGQTGVIQTIGAGGLRPVSGFAGDFDNNGFTDLVVGDNGDGRFTLFTGGAEGLSLSQTITSDDVPSPTSLSFAGVTDGVLSFYASTMGHEAATLLAFNLEAAGGAGGSLSGEGLAGGTDQSAGATLASATAGVFQQVAQLLGRSGSPLDLVAPLFTVSVIPGEFDLESSGEGGVGLLASFTPGAGLGQSLRPNDDGADGEPAAETQTPTPAEQATRNATQGAAPLPLWGRMAMGLEQAWEQVRAELLEKSGVAPDAVDRADAARDRAAPAQERSSDGSGPQRGLPPKAEVTSRAIQELVAERDAEVPSQREPSGDRAEVVAIRRGPIVAAVAVASVATIGTYIEAGRFRRSRRRHPGLVDAGRSGTKIRLWKECRTYFS